MGVLVELTTPLLVLGAWFCLWSIHSTEQEDMGLLYRLSVLLVVCVMLQHCLGISFHLEPDARKCLREEVHADVLVVGEYSLEEVHGQKTNIEVSCVLLWSIVSNRLALLRLIQVIDSKGHVLFRKEDILKGKFAFTTEEYEIFDVCFLTHTSGKHFEVRKNT